MSTTVATGDAQADEVLALLPTIHSSCITGASQGQHLTVFLGIAFETQPHA
jgi:hypothetical protein